MAEFSEHEFHVLLNSLNEGVCYLNAQGELLSYNQTAQAHWGIDHPFTYKLSLQPPVARALAGEHVYHELVHVHKNRSLLVNALPLQTETNTTTGVVVVSQDVSDHVLMEQQAQTALNVLLEAMLNTSHIQSIDEVLRRLAVLIPQLESVDNSIAFRLDDATGKIIPLALFGNSQQSYEAWHTELAAIEFSAEQTIQNSSPAYLQALRMARPLMVDFTVDTPPSNPFKLRAAIYVPVLLNGHVVGLLGAERHRPPEAMEAYFPDWNVSLLTALARLASMSLEKATLHTSIERLQAEATDIRTLLNQKEELLLLAAHELKNPLTAILGQAQVLRRRLNRTLHAHTNVSQETHDLMRGLESIEHQARRIGHMVNTLMEVSRVDLDHLELDLQEIDLLQLVRRALREYLPLAPKHELRLFVNKEWQPILVDDETTTGAISIQADEQRLEQVITNLISNAIKYSPEGGPITVSLQQTDAQIELTIADQGIGVPLKEQARLAERFYRAENAQMTTSKGLGLGLYLVNALVKNHGGSLSMKSEGVPGKGSVFSITLPYQK